MAREQRRARFKELLASGMSPENAVKQAQLEDAMGQRLQDRVPPVRLSQEPGPGSEPGPWDELETVGRMSREGITAGWGSELKGAAGAVGQEVADWFTPGPGQPFMENYRQIRDEDEARNELLRQRDPLLANTAQLGGALATGIATGGLVAAPATAMQAAGQGVAYGAAVGLGESKADLTQGDWGETGEALADMGKGAVVGGVLAPVGHKIMQRMINGPVSKTQKAVTQAAKKVDPSAPSGLGAGVSNVERFERGVEAESYGNRMLEAPGQPLAERPFKLTPSQKLGDPELYQAEANAQKYPDVLRVAEQQAKDQQLQVSAILEKQVDELAADPSKLSRGTVGKDVADGIDEVTKSIVTTRKVVTTPILDEAIALSQAYGEQPNIPWPHGREVARRWFIEGKEALSPLSQERAADLVRLLKNNQITLKQMQGALSDYGDEAALSGKIFADIDSAKGRRFASEMRGALLKDLDVLSKKDTYTGAAGQRLKDFHSEYKKYSDQIDEIDTRVIKQILNVEAGGAAEAVTTKLMRAEPEEISFVVDVLSRSKPERVQQLRAQVLEDIAVSSGKRQRADKFSAEYGKSNLSYDKLDNFLYNGAGKIDALYSGDPKAQLAITELRELTQHLAYTPAQTRQQESSIASVAGEAAVRGVGWKAGGIPAGTSTGMLNAIKSLINNEKNIAQALQTPEGIDLFNQALRLQLRGGAAPVEEMQAVISGLAQLGVGAAKNVEDYNKPSAAKER